MAYTNSPLVSYTKLSPNHSGQRTHSIDRITPHCVVGQCSVETLGNIMYPTSRQASCNYGMKTNEEYSKENRALRRDIKELYSENTKMEKELAKLRKQLMEAESAIKNLKDELLKAQTELMLSRMDKKI